jgi:F-type H+-transporting ATPase subunit gamma
MSLAELERQREAAETVHDIVAAMRSMAAGRVQGSQRALASARAYEDVVLGALRAAAAEHALAPGETADAGEIDLLIVTSEQGLCGAFNQNVLALAQQHRQVLATEGRVHAFVVGRTGGRKLGALGWEADAVYPAAVSVPGLRDAVRRVSAALVERYAAGRTRALEVVYSRYLSVSQQVPSVDRILPLPVPSAPAASGGPAPAHRHYLALPELVTGLIAEYVFISLYRLLAESYASEQASRLVAMDSATRNTAEFLDDLRRQERRERQNLVTRQVLELIAARRAGARSR